MYITRTITILLLLFVFSACYAGDTVIKTDTDDKLKQNPPLPVRPDIQGEQKMDLKDGSVKKKVTWGDLPNLEKQPTPKRHKLSSKDRFFSDKNHTFENEIAFIKDEIAKAHENVDATRIRRMHKKVYALNYEEEVWEQYARAQNIYRWPSQKSWQDVVAGYLFFPQDTFDWEILSTEKHHLFRIDNLWCYAASAKSNHAVGKFYLIRILHNIHQQYFDDCPLFFKQHYEEAFEDMKQCEDSSDACYVIGVNFEQEPFLSSTYIKTKTKQESSDPLYWYTKGSDLKNSYRILCLKELLPHLPRQVTKDDFLALGRAGFRPAYKKALELTATLAEEDTIIKELDSAEFRPAIYWQGTYHRQKGDDQKGRGLYQKAGQMGVSWGYINLGMLEVGNIDSLILDESKSDELKEHFEKLPQEKIERAIELFTLAGEAQNPEGWEYLAELYGFLLQYKRIEKDELKSMYLHCLKKGIALGSADCYWRAKNYVSERSFTILLQQYGDPSYLLWKTIEDFFNH